MNRKKMTKEVQMAGVEELTAQLKNNMDALDRLRMRRREVKSSLAKEGLTDDEEVRLATELGSIGSAIAKLEVDRKRIYDALK